MPRLIAKPIVKVFLVPGEWKEKQLQDCFDELVAAAKTVPVMRVSSEEDIIVLFPKDLMRKGLGTEVVIEVSLNFYPGLGDTQKRDVAYAMWRVMQDFLPKAHIQCTVSTFETVHGYFESGFVQ